MASSFLVFKNLVASVTVQIYSSVKKTVLEICKKKNALLNCVVLCETNVLFTTLRSLDLL